MKILRDLSVFLFAAITLMSAVATSTYYGRFGIADVAQKMPALSLLIEGIVSTLGSVLPLVLLAAIVVAALICEIGFTIQLGSFGLRSKYLPLLLAPLAVVALVSAGKNAGLARYQRAISRESTLPVVASIRFSDDDKCNADDVDSCLRRTLPDECIHETITEDCRVVHQSDQALYLVGIADRNLRPFARRISMGKVEHVTLAVPEEPLS